MPRRDLAPAGAIWICGACGVLSDDRYAFRDGSCFLNAVLVKNDKPAGVSVLEHRWAAFEPEPFPEVKQASLATKALVMLAIVFALAGYGCEMPPAPGTLTVAKDTIYAFAEIREVGPYTCVLVEGGGSRVVSVWCERRGERS